MVPVTSLQSETAPRQEVPLNTQTFLELIQVLPPKPAAAAPAAPTETDEVESAVAVAGEQAAAKSNTKTPPVFSVQSPSKPAGPGADTPVTGAGNGDLWQGPGAGPPAR